MHDTMKKIVLVITGSIAAVKSYELVRALQRNRVRLQVVLSKDAQRFVTPLSLSALNDGGVFYDGFTDSDPLRHIRLKDDIDGVVVAPASASFIGRLASGLGDDLASAFLLSCNGDKVLLAPAMNPSMWSNPIVQRNVAYLREQGFTFIEPDDKQAACGDTGVGPMASVESLVVAIENRLGDSTSTLRNKRVLVTSGPTHESLDSVRFLSNRSSGRQGHAIAAAFATAGADTCLVRGPVALDDPIGVNSVRVHTAAEMLKACQERMPVDVVVCAAAVSDWRARTLFNGKWSKDNEHRSVALERTEDILGTLARPSAKSATRAALVIGFAAEVGDRDNDVIARARRKRQEKGCDWMLMNDVGTEPEIMGGTHNHVVLITQDATEHWQPMPKQDVARKLVSLVADHFATGEA